MSGSAKPEFRIGHGFDLHRLEPLAPEGEGRPFILGGVYFDHPRGPVGHSDGDTLLHAVTDAILGALGEPDIGQLFPNDDPAHESEDSRVFLQEAIRRMQQVGYAISNLDVTVICEQPKLGSARQQIEEILAHHLACDIDMVNVKGKTHEQVDAIGQGKAVAVHAVVLLEQTNI